MYTPSAFAVTDEAQIELALRAAGFGLLVSHGPAGLSTTHMPFLYDQDRRTLAGHMARPNPHGTDIAGGEAVAIFTGPQAYVSPGWYATKAEHGRVVPTWNYEALHVTGRLSVHEDPAWLRAHLSAMTNRFEAGQPHPWSIDDAPEAYVAGLINGIVGIELAIERVELKRKLSQNKSRPDRLGVIAGLSASVNPADHAIAEAMQALEED